LLLPFISFIIFSSFFNSGENPTTMSPLFSCRTRRSNSPRPFIIIIFSKQVHISATPRGEASKGAVRVLMTSPAMGEQPAAEAGGQAGEQGAAAGATGGKGAEAAAGILISGKTTKRKKSV
jgi:hypothetical protein